MENTRHDSIYFSPHLDYRHRDPLGVGAAAHLAGGTSLPGVEDCCQLVSSGDVGNARHFGNKDAGDGAGEFASERPGGAAVQTPVSARDAVAAYDHVASTGLCIQARAAQNPLFWLVDGEA